MPIVVRYKDGTKVSLQKHVRLLANEGNRIKAQEQRRDTDGKYRQESSD